MRRNGLGFITLSLVTIVLMILGLAVSSWFAASQDTFGGLFTTNVRLTGAEFCANTLCVDYMASIPGGEAYGATGVITLVVGVFFALTVATGVFQRISQGMIPTWLRYAGYLLGTATLVLSLSCMYLVPPDHITLDMSRFGVVLTSADQRMLVGDLTLSFGGLFTVFGTVFGLVLLRGGSPLPDEETAEIPVARAKKPRREVMLTPPPRGVETDPFRAPPAPPPVAVVKNDRPVTAPIEFDPDDEAPKLLR